MAAAHYLAIWAGLDREHDLGTHRIPALPEQRVWADGRWRSAFSRSPVTERPRHRLAVPARRRHAMPRILAR